MHFAYDSYDMWHCSQMQFDHLQTPLPNLINVPVHAAWHCHDHLLSIITPSTVIQDCNSTFHQVCWRHGCAALGDSPEYDLLTNDKV